MSTLPLTTPLLPAKPQPPVVLGLYALALLLNEVALRLLDHYLLTPLFGLVLVAPQNRQWIGWVLVGLGSVGAIMGVLSLGLAFRAIVPWAKGWFHRPASLTRQTVLNLFFMAGAYAVALMLPGGIVARVFEQALRIFVQLRVY